MRSHNGGKALLKLLIPHQMQLGIANGVRCWLPHHCEAYADSCHCDKKNGGDDKETRFHDGEEE